MLTSELTLAVGSEADRANHDGYGAWPLAASVVCRLQVRYDEIPNEMKNMLIKVGSKLDFIGKDIPVLSVPGSDG